MSPRFLKKFENESLLLIQKRPLIWRRANNVKNGNSLYPQDDGCGEFR